MSKAKPGTTGAAGSSSQGFSKSTVRTMKMLQREFGRREETGEDAVVRYEEMAGKAKRRDAVKLFFELLVLTTKDVVQVRQTESYGGIEVRPKVGILFFFWPIMYWFISYLSIFKSSTVVNEAFPFFRYRSTGEIV